MNKRPDNIALFCFMTAGVYFSFLMLVHPWYFLFLFPAGILFFVKQFRLFLSVFLAGALLFLSRNYEFSTNRDLSGQLAGRDIIISGAVHSVQEHTINSNMILSGDTLSTGGSKYAVQMKFSAVLPLKNAERGDRIRIKGKFREFKEPSNLYEKDMKHYAFINNIYGEISDAEVISFERKNSVWRKMSGLQDKIIAVFDRRLSFSAGNFLTAVMIGKRDKLESSVIKEFADSGTIHLLAVSGLHVGFLILILTLLSSLLNLKGWIYIAVNSSALLGYAAFTGASSSVIRAVLMSIILMLSHPLKRKIRFVDVIGTAGIISLIFDPAQIFNPGFILSFTAVASIAVIYEPVSAAVNKRFPSENYFFKTAADGLVLSFCVTIGLLPFVLYIFGKYNFLSILSNVILIPLTGAAFLCGILLLCFDKSEIIAQFISDIINVLGYLISKTVEITAGAELFTLKYKSGLITAVILISAVIMVFYFKKTGYKLSVSVVLIAVLISQIAIIKNGPELYAFSTKAGGSLVIDNCGENIFIAGKLTVPEIRRIINPYLSEKNITELDYIVCSDDWITAEKMLKEIAVPVRHLVSDRDYSNLSGDFDKINLNYINRIVKFSGGLIYFLNDGKFKIFTVRDTFNSDDLFSSNRGIDRKF